MTTAPGWIDRLPSDRLVCEYSVWSADLLALGAELKRVRPHADMLHVDVADGRFAPAFLFFPDLVAAVRRASDLPIHVHLMVEDDLVLPQIGQFAEGGADLVSIHAENAAVAHEALARLDALGIAGGMALRVGTPVERVAPFLPRLRFLTLLGTAIGVKGQGLDPAACDRLTRAKRLVAESGAGHRIVLAADGGIRETTVPLLRAAGAETVVLGSLALDAPDLAARTAWLHGL